jgi:hypothetical protein
VVKMAVVNNPVVGTLHCDKCRQVASLHVTKRGKGKDKLYKRCRCGCQQTFGDEIQEEWRQNMIPRPGFEHLAEPKPEPEQPEPITEAEPKPEPEPLPDVPEKHAGSNEPETEAPSSKKRGGFSAGGALVLCLGLGITLMTLGRVGPMS